MTPITAKPIVTLWTRKNIINHSVTLVSTMHTSRLSQLKMPNMVRPTSHVQCSSTEISACSSNSCDSQELLESPSNDGPQARNVPACHGHASMTGRYTMPSSCANETTHKPWLRTSTKISHPNGPTTLSLYRDVPLVWALASQQMSLDLLLHTAIKAHAKYQEAFSVSARQTGGQLA